MTLDELHDAYGYGMLNLGIKSLAHVANTAIRAAIDAGQVVTREEFDKVTAELKVAQMALWGVYRIPVPSFNIKEKA